MKKVTGEDDLFGTSGVPSPCMLKTCSGITEVAGSNANNFVVASLDGKTLVEYNIIPDNRSEIPISDIAQYFPPLAPVANKMPPADSSATILLLSERDIFSVHKQHNGPHKIPYAQCLD